MTNFFEFILHDNNVAFLVAASLLLAVLALELLTLVVGGSLSFLDGDADFDVDADSDGIAGGVLAWVNPGRVPFMMLLTIFMAAFACSGLILQWVLVKTAGFMLNPLMSIPVAAAVALPFVQMGSRVLNRIMPKELTSAIATDSLVGNYGVITMGPATAETAGQARFRDDFGTSHYLTVLSESGAIEAGSNVVLIAPHESLSHTYVVRQHTS